MKILKASPGCIFTDGESYGKSVALADGADPSVWKEISEELAEKQQAEKAAAEMVASGAVQTLTEGPEDLDQAPTPTRMLKPVGEPRKAADGHLMIAIAAPTIGEAPVG